MPRSAKEAPAKERETGTERRARITTESGSGVRFVSDRTRAKGSWQFQIWWEAAGASAYRVIRDVTARGLDRHAFARLNNRRRNVSVCSTHTVSMPLAVRFHVCKKS
jgi:hypothetical protein